ncbi:MAG TPA: hypothetical protein VKZ89_11210 [Thermobifida alba]|nr:hypothetical protein [Thermobifida alba]
MTGHVYTADGQRLYTTAQLAETLGIAPQTVRVRWHRRQIPDPHLYLDGRTPLWTRPKEHSMDTQTITDQVRATLGDEADGFDVEAIVEEIGDTFGRDKVRTVDDVPSEAYWDIVRKHERPTAYTKS